LDENADVGNIKMGLILQEEELDAAFGEVLEL
jgi:hypothetical protein